MALAAQQEKAAKEGKRDAIYNAGEEGQQSWEGLLSTF